MVGWGRVGVESHHWVHLWEENGSCVQRLPAKADLDSHICTASLNGKHTGLCSSMEKKRKKQRPCL